MDGAVTVPLEPPPPAPLAKPRWSGLAITSLLFGIAVFPLAFVIANEPAILLLPPVLLCGFVAVVTGHLAWHQIRKSTHHLIGSGLAWIGIILGYSWLLLVGILIHQESRANRIAIRTSNLAIATALESAINSFHAEYDTLPDVPAPVTTDTADGVKLLDILLALDEHSAKEQNTHKIKFLTVRDGKNNKNGLINAARGHAIEGLYDRWGNPFTVELAKPGENHLHFTIGSTTIDLPGRRVAVISPGKDRILGTADDIRTW